MVDRIAPMMTHDYSALEALLIVEGALIGQKLVRQDC